MAAKLVLSGTFAFSFTGFDHVGSQARHVVGVGRLVLTPAAGGKGGTITNGDQMVSNSPMTGLSADFLHSRYTLTGTYDIIEAGPPLVAKADVTFTQTSKSPDRRQMTDTFALVQVGPDRLRMISTNPQDGHGPIQELVMGELIKVDAATW
jgi:hypothetical protein